jgi:hypothetical protein
MSDQRKSSAKSRRGAGQLSWAGFFVRFAFAFILVIVTYNPSGYSYVGWLKSFESGNEPYKLLAGALLLAGYAVYLRATAHSLGKGGALLLTTIFGLIMWVLIDAQIIETDATVITWVLEFFTALLLAVGMTGAFIWRRLTGQYHVADADDLSDI